MQNCDQGEEDGGTEDCGMKNEQNKIGLGVLTFYGIMYGSGEFQREAIRERKMGEGGTGDFRVENE